MKITERQLRRIIKEELMYEAYGMDTLKKGADWLGGKLSAAEEKAKEVISDSFSQLSPGGINTLKHFVGINVDAFKWLKGDIEIEELGQEFLDYYEGLPSAVLRDIQGLRDNISGIVKLMPLNLFVEITQAVLDHQGK